MRPLDFLLAHQYVLNLSWHNIKRQGPKVKVTSKGAMQRARNTAKLEDAGPTSHLGRNLVQTEKAKLGPREAKAAREQLFFYPFSVNTSPPHRMAWSLGHLVYFPIVKMLMVFTNLPYHAIETVM